MSTSLNRSGTKYANFSIVFMKMLTYDNFLTVQFNIYLKRVVNCYIPVDRKFEGLQNDAKLRG